MEVGASERTRGHYLRLDRREVHVEDDRDYSRRQVDAENDACGWRKIAKVEGQVDSSHDAAAG